VRTVIALLASLLLSGSILAQEWNAVVLKANSVEDNGSRNLVITLASGTTIEIPSEDWSSEWSEAVNEALKSQEAERAARSSAEPPSDAGAASMIRSKCASEWPDDYQMRKYCEDQQYEGLRALRARQMTGGLVRVRSKCANEWPNDFQMRDYCEKQQLEALRELNR